MATRSAPHAEPFDRLALLVAEAKDRGVPEPNAMQLATVGEGGRPSSRVVLLKGLDERGLVFYTNLESRKGRQLTANPWVSLAFWWRDAGVQVEAQGRAVAVPDEEADAYFASRDRGSQLGAWASQQSRPLASRAALLAEVAKVEARHLGRAVPRPPHWSGLRVAPDRFEFWRSGLFRLHERELYEREGEGWRVTLLFP
jgi:pyridoxamine 5'-phosphate oxidase